jgi:magnesium chelatase family protein
MSLAVAFARAQLGLHAPLIIIETHLTAGLPAFGMVGLPETAVRESRERVRSAILNAGFEFPQHRITINLAPANIPKEGTRFDLAIALSILAASGQLRATALTQAEFVAELALTGELRSVRTVLAAALGARDLHRDFYCAIDDSLEAGLCEGITVFTPRDLREVCAHLDGSSVMTPLPMSRAVPELSVSALDFAEVRGQRHAKRGLEIAAVGGHNVIMSGPPGTGKTMLAMRLPSLLPPLSEAEALEVAVIRSAANITTPPSAWREPPFRAPHHTASTVAIVGGGTIPKPGEISLAHHGVLFLDELPEFDRRVLEALRQPLESGLVRISRAASQAEFPASLLLVGALNPCPCGYAGDPSRECLCSPEKIARYRGRISGPILDRIDIQLEVHRETDWLQSTSNVRAETSADIAARVLCARQIQLSRQGTLNARLTVPELERVCMLDNATTRFLHKAFAHYNLSARSYHRILKLGRSIADVDGRETITQPDLAEALALRKLEMRANRRTNSAKI